jgi:hypothetical protein
MHPLDHSGVQGHSVFLCIPLLPGVAQPAILNDSSQKNDNKNTYIGHLLPDFYLQKTCKFAVRSATWITALAA